MKRRLGLILLVTMIFTCALGVFAYNDELKAVVTNIKLYLNGNRVDKEVVIIGESSYLPVRAISEALGLEVNWDGDNNSIYLSQKSTSGDAVLLNEFGIVDKLQKENKELKQKITKLEQQLKQTSNTSSTTNTQTQTKPTYPSTTLTAKSENSAITLNWSEINNTKFQGYKVVISKNDSTPKYPDNGYLYWITDKSKTSATVDNSSKYNGGDFGGYLVPGQSYYISVTAVYSDGTKVPGNVVTCQYPAKEETTDVEEETDGYVTPVLKAETNDGKVYLSWNQIDSEGFQGYKVVMSKTDSMPQYPENGYLYWLPDKYKTSAVVEADQYYNNGDFKYVASGENYYFSITAVYNDKKVPGNVLEITVP